MDPDFAPEPPIQPTPARRWRRKPVIAALATVLSLLAGLVVWQVGPWHKPPAPDTAPFFVAVYNLATEPMLQYSGGSSTSGTSWTITVTSGGEQTGTVSSDGQNISILTVGGKTYFKPPQSMLDQLPTTVPESSLTGQWLTGDDTLQSAMPTGLDPPAALATTLLTNLSKVTTFPRIGAPATTVGGAPALQVALPDGTLVVSAKAPYRVLGLQSAAGASPSPTTAPTRPNRNADVLAAAISFPFTAANPAVPGQFSLDQLSPADMDQTYGDLIGQTKTLTSAVDIGVSFDFNQTGNLGCSDSSCTVTEDVTTSTTADQAATLSGTVTADMTADVTVDGQSAGSCTQSASLPLNGAGTMTCVDAAVAPIVEQIESQEQELADEEAQEDPGQQISIPYTIDYEAEVAIEAMADYQAEVDQEVGTEEGEQQSADQAQQQADQAEGPKGDSCTVPGSSGAAGRAILAGTVLVADGAEGDDEAQDCSSEALEIAEHALDRSQDGSSDAQDHVIPGVAATEKAYAEYADSVMDRPNVQMAYRPSDNSTAYWDPDKSVIIIVSTKGLSTMFVPKDGYTYLTDNFTLLNY